MVSTSTRSISSRRAATSRGFSLLAVLFVVIVLALIGSAAFLIGSSDATSAGATEVRSRALAAAEAGLGLFASGASPSEIVADKGATPVKLPNLDGITDPRTEYVIIGRGQDAAAGKVISEGRVLRDDRIVGRAQIEGAFIVETFDQPYSQSEGSGPQGTNTISFGRQPFKGGSI